jgi:ribose transport system permease protein
MATPRRLLLRFLSDHGMLLVLLILGAYYSYATLSEQYPGGAAGGEQLAEEILHRTPPDAQVLIVARTNREDAELADALERRLDGTGRKVLEKVMGQPADAREALDERARNHRRLDAIAASREAGAWPVLTDLGRRYPGLTDVPVYTPRGYWWPSFLKADNLLNIANQIAVIAIIAVGMTMVIITGGIDLSVGSLMALSAVTATLLIRDAAGAEEASVPAMIVCCLAAIAGCTGVGLLSGLVITTFAIPPFIVTLAVMLVASGLAYIVSEGQSVYEVPDSFVWLGRGADVVRIPNAVILMAALYVIAQLLMTRTTLGRYIYAVGGNVQAAKLSGIRVRRILIFVYVVSSALAGLGGVVMASQLKSGAPTYGQMYELYVIAAVVVGGTSLGGGEGKIFGTLTGAFVIAVIQNGMNLTGVESYTQKVVLGLVILGALLLDRLRKHGATWLKKLKSEALPR